MISSTQKLASFFKKQTDILTEAEGNPRISTSHSPNSTIVDAETSSGVPEISIDGAEISIDGTETSIDGGEVRKKQWLLTTGILLTRKRLKPMELFIRSVRISSGRP